MSSEMRVFVSRIVWLFSITVLFHSNSLSTDLASTASSSLDSGGISADPVVESTPIEITHPWTPFTNFPNNFVLVKGSDAKLFCVMRNLNATWFYKSFIQPARDDAMPATDEHCKAIIPFVDAEEDAGWDCNLIVKGTVNQTTFKYTCKDGEHAVSGILIFIESPPKCEIKHNQYTCTMVHSGYFNQTAIETPYLSIRLTWKDNRGKIISEKYADFQETQTEVRAPIPDAASSYTPYVCSAEFKMVGDLGKEYWYQVDIEPDGKLECKSPDAAEHEKETQVLFHFKTLSTDLASTASPSLDSGSN